MLEILSSNITRESEHTLYGVALYVLTTSVEILQVSARPACGTSISAAWQCGIDDFYICVGPQHYERKGVGAGQLTEPAPLSTSG